jgi:hypothetical protein
MNIVYLFLGFIVLGVLSILIDWLIYKNRGRANSDHSDSNPPLITGLEEPMHNG